MIHSAAHGNILEAGDDEGRYPVALYPLAHKHVLLRMPERQPHRVVDDQLLCPLIEANAGRLVPLRTRLLQQAVQFSITVAGMVLIALAVEEDVQEVMRVDVVRDPAEREQAVSTPIELAQERGELDLLHLHVDAQVRAPLLEYGLDRAWSGSAAAGQREDDTRQARRAAVTGSCESGFGRLGVES